MTSRRGVRLRDLPDEVVRDLGELAPKPEDVTAAHHPRYGRKRGGIERLSMTIHGAPRMSEAAKAAIAEVGNSIRKAVKNALANPPAEPKKPSKRQMSVENFDLQLRQRGYVKGRDFVRELKFAKGDSWESRGWRFDFAFPKYKLAIEIEGLVVRMVRDINTMKPMRIVTGRHATITGMREDFHKYGAAAILGWHVIRVEQDMIANGDAAGFVERFIARRKHEQAARKVRKAKR